MGFTLGFFLWVTLVTTCLGAEIREDVVDGRYEVMSFETVGQHHMVKRSNADATFDGSEPPVGKPLMLDEAEVNHIILLHNELRQKESAANMEEMHWDEQLANMAQYWSERCVFGHGYYINVHINFQEVGQNLYFKDVRYAVDDAIHAFYNEKQWYNATDNDCEYVCGHYTQVVWSTTTSVGCGRTFCPELKYNNRVYKGYIMVCNYGPTGNLAGTTPYTEGKNCSACDEHDLTCVDGLCSEHPPEDCEHTSEEAGHKEEAGHECYALDRPVHVCEEICENGGTLDNVTCTCACGRKYIGELCADKCSNTKPGCRVWPKEWCEHRIYKYYMPKWCPLLCGECDVDETLDCDKCKDVSPYCWAWTGSCSMELYRPFLLARCPRTCNMCAEVCSYSGP